MLWRLASAWGDSPPRNSWTTCRLNSIECVRCLAMGFLLESPVQLADSQVLHLSTPRGALHFELLVCAELVQAVNADLNRLGVVVGDTVDVFGAAHDLLIVAGAFILLVSQR